MKKKDRAKLDKNKPRIATIEYYLSQGAEVILRRVHDVGKYDGPFQVQAMVRYLHPRGDDTFAVVGRNVPQALDLVTLRRDVEL